MTVTSVADSPSRNTRAASSAGQPKKKHAPLPKTKTNSKQGTSLAQSLDDDGQSQRLFCQQYTPIQSHIAPVPADKNSKVPTNKNSKQKPTRTANKKSPSSAQAWDIFCSLSWLMNVWSQVQ
jgi:hypothetical protein